MEAKEIAEIREIVRGWGKYGPHYDDEGQWIGTWWEAVDVDSLTDDELLDVAQKIADGGKK